MGDLAAVCQCPQDVVRQVRVRINQRAGDALLVELDEEAGQELALALPGETDDVLMRRDPGRVEPELAPEECRTVRTKREGRAIPGKPALQGPSTGSSNDTGCSPNG